MALKIVKFLKLLIKLSFSNELQYFFAYFNKGFSSVEEQIADYFGIVNSMKAYMKTIENNENMEKNLKLPRLDQYTQQQLFLIRHAESYCRVKDIENIQFHSYHPVHDYRVFQTSLTPEFEKEFKCKKTNKFQIKTCKIFDT